jgi:hypothetical protein
MTKVFISYTRRGDYDRQFADYLRKQLTAWGFQPWMDVYDIPSGDHWDDAIDAALKSSDVVLGLLSPASVESDNVKNEWAWALQKGKLHLLRLASCDVPHRFIRIDFIDFAADQNAGMTRLHRILTTPGMHGTTTSSGVQNTFKRISNTFRAVPAAASQTMAQGGLPRGLLIGGVVGAAVTLIACVALVVGLLLRGNDNSGSSGAIDQNNSGISQQSQQFDPTGSASQFITEIFNGDATAAANLTCPERRSQLRLEIEQIILQFEAVGGLIMGDLSCHDSNIDEVVCEYIIFSPISQLSSPVTLRLPMSNGLVCPASMAFLTS